MSCRPTTRSACGPSPSSMQTETEAVIAKGVEAGERVVTTGFARLKDGARVVVAHARGADAGSRTPSRRQPRPSPMAARKMRAACADDIAEVLRQRRAQRELRGCLQANAAQLSDACKVAATAAAATASRARPTRARPKAARRNERLRALHPAADRHVAARLCRAAGRCARLLVAAGLVAAAGRFPDHPGDDAAAGRQPRDDGQPGHGAARAPARADPVARHR